MKINEINNEERAKAFKTVKKPEVMEKREVHEHKILA